MKIKLGIVVIYNLNCVIFDYSFTPKEKQNGNHQNEKSSRECRTKSIRYPNWRQTNFQIL